MGGGRRGDDGRVSWEQLVGARRENEQAEAWERDQPPAYCPHDGATLIERRDGARDCPMGNFRWEP